MIRPIVGIRAAGVCMGCPGVKIEQALIRFLQTISPCQKHDFSSN
jgi:hypothetical protein